jgi:hypothetical protein
MCVGNFGGPRRSRSRLSPSSGWDNMALRHRQHTLRARVLQTSVRERPGRVQTGSIVRFPGIDISEARGHGPAWNWQVRFRVRLAGYVLVVVVVCLVLIVCMYQVVHHLPPLEGTADTDNSLRICGQERVLDFCTRDSTTRGRS